jgi:conjugal transfer ATP-binding protein TraC
MKGVLSDLLQIWGFQDDFCIFSDGSLGFALKLTGKDLKALSDDDVSSFSLKLNGLLNSLPEELKLQFVMTVCDDNVEVLERYRKLSIDTLNTVAKTLAESRYHKLCHESSLGLIPRYEIEVFVRRSFGNDLFSKTNGFRKNKKTFTEIGEENFLIEIKSFEQLRDQIIREFANAGISSEIVNSNKLFKKLYKQWNPAREIEKDDYNPNHLRENIIFTDALVYEDGFALGTIHHRVLSLKLIPQEVFSGMSQAFLNLPVGAKLFLSIHIPNQAIELKSLQTQRRVSYSMSEGKKGVRDLESESKFRDSESLLDELLSQEEKVFKMSLQVVLASADQTELGLMTREALLTFRALNGAEGMTESLAGFDIFSEICLPNASTRERVKKMKTSYLTEFLPLANTWAGHENPRVLFKTTSDTLLSIDPYSSTLSNFNQIICGASGSGKSFVATNIIAQLQKDNPRTFIIDVGGSYRKLCSIIDGQYILLTLDSNIALNPFDLPPNELRPSPQHIKYLVSLVEKMTIEEGQRRVARIERALIEEAIEQVYQQNQEPRLTHLRAILATHADSQMKQISKILGPWCGDTAFGRIVDRPTNVALNKSMVCFDLMGLKSVADLQSVAIHLITNFIEQQILKAPLSVIKPVIVDEAWELLADEAGANLIESFARKIRKSFGGLIPISQNIDDFAKSGISQALLPNCATKWILNQGDADKERLREVLNLNPNEAQLISQLKQVKGEYSQSFLMTGENRAVVSIEPSAYEYWVATTDAPDLSVFNEELAKTPTEDVSSVLSRLAKKFPKGVSAWQRSERAKAI